MELSRSDTFTKPKHTSLASYRSGDLAVGRTTVPNDLGEIPQVSLEYFKSAVLPPLRGQIDISKIKTSLEGAEAWSRHSGWTAIKEPKLSGVSEEETFEPLSKVFDAVVREVGKVASTSATLRFSSRPSHSPLSDRSNATRPGACLLLVEKKNVDSQGAKKNNAGNSDPDSWYDIAVSFEFKKGNRAAERDGNDKKVISSLHHIMCSDPRRRATFGVTIENTEMRFWFTCRAVTLVSKWFDFLTEPEHLIHLFCALAFADDHELGWDPTIQRVCVEGKTQYIVTVRADDGRALEYQITRVISDFSGYGMRGRGTRVFEVRLRSPDGNLDTTPLVLKDSWRDCDQEREDKILEQVFDDLRKLKGIEAEEEARKYFLTIIDAGDVMVNGIIDGTANLLHGSDLPADCTSYVLSVDGILKAKPTWSSERFTPSFPRVPGATMHSKIHHRIHFRLVFKEVCTPIYELQHLDTVFKTLQDVYKALQFLHSAGWVHRDVSTGNALRAGEVGKLADLEYAKRMDFDATHDVPTGTLDFMACEVEAKNYLFKPFKVVPIDDFSEDDEDEFPFKFNPLHDMESLWWIPTWILYRHVDSAGDQRSEAQRKWFQKLFPGQLNARTSAFLADVDYRVLPTSFQSAAFIVTSAMRQVLKRAYTTSENSMPPVYTDALAELQLVFTSYLAAAAERSKHVRLHTPGI